MNKHVIQIPLLVSSKPDYQGEFQKIENGLLRVNCLRSKYA